MRQETLLILLRWKQVVSKVWISNNLQAAPGERAASRGKDVRAMPRSLKILFSLSSKDRRERIKLNSWQALP